MTPRRIQRRRTKGWRMPDGAIYVGRPTRWGNPFVVCPAAPLGGCSAHGYDCVAEPLSATVRFRHAILFPLYGEPYVPGPDEIRGSLRSHDLACWCPLDQPCHADVLLEVANP